MREFKDKLVWENVSKKQTFSYEFYSEFKNKLSMMDIKAYNKDSIVMIGKIHPVTLRQASMARRMRINPRAISVKGAAKPIENARS